jgi:hypothetical protein
MKAILRDRRKDPGGLPLPSVRTTLELEIEVPESEVRKVGESQIGADLEIEAAIPPDPGGRRRAYLQPEYDELSVPGVLRLVNVRVAAPEGLPRDVPRGTSIRLRGMVAVSSREGWQEARIW